MKNVIMASVLMLTSTSSFATIEGSAMSKVCRGEFTESIVESVKACSAKDLAQAQVEIYSLEEQVVSLRNQILEAEAYVSSPQYDKDNKKSHTLAVTVVGGTLLGLAIAGVGWKIKNTTVSNIGGVISILMSIGLGYGSLKMGYQPVKFTPNQIPQMKAKVTQFLEQVRVRKSLIDAANAIKAAQTPVATN